MASWHAGIPAALAAACLVLGGCTAPPAPSPHPLSEPADGAVRMAAVGDSITAADSIDLAGGRPGPRSWVSHAVGPEVEFVGGWAEWGATTEQMAHGVQGPLDADVLVILAGTNDAGWVGHERIGANLDRIAEEAGVGTVVLSSVPPIDSASRSAVELNAHLERFAGEQGWVWVDAAAALRDDEGERFAPGMSDDGVHPTQQGARVLGEAIGEAVVRAAGR
ncbi:GDSL-like lipase/acylhydrolase family protein [Brevibacterium sanguinis]|uniref:GDSL-like lipase/acylhydrolase family protein n=2 Tax=Brevibacterium TaxID=1696 RepID=A0A366IKM6_9MICO|nr:MULTISPECIES: SGNH/GDSL hydrolase family protein [Brevibacterium]RBP65504.1 GDSL-like lipase/acylhydrolase family protein [Brevibacterium sanguinis]RBP72138.1 GDSL-like lipase/acylhydrolase family protein [Brevibacterium celere]